MDMGIQKRQQTFERGSYKTFCVVEPEKEVKLWSSTVGVGLEDVLQSVDDCEQLGRS